MLHSVQRSSGRRRSSAGKFPEFFWGVQKLLQLSKGEEDVAIVSPKLVIYVEKGWEGRPRAIEKYVDAKEV